MSIVRRRLHYWMESPETMDTDGNVSPTCAAIATAWRFIHEKRFKENAVRCIATGDGGIEIATGIPACFALQIDENGAAEMVEYDTFKVTSRRPAEAWFADAGKMPVVV